LALPAFSSLREAATPPLLSNWREARARGLGLRQLYRLKGWHLEMLPSLAFLKDGLVMDIGAHEGTWTADLLNIVPSVHMIACEPQADLRERIERRFAGDDRVTVEGRALAAGSGTRRLHLMDASTNASLHPPQPGMNDLYTAGWDERGTVEVETTTVDELTAGRDVALLKIDVQGAEREVLAGARETLARTSAVMLEVTFVSHYDGDGTFPALHEAMSAAGFNLTGISAPTTSPRGALLCSDAAYVSARHLDEHFSRRA
jgi:FkbM family methyltransferase